MELIKYKIFLLKEQIFFINIKKVFHFKKYSILFIITTILNIIIVQKYTK